MSTPKERPFRGAEFDPDEAATVVCGTVDEKVAGPDHDLDDEADGQVEGVFAARLGNEAVTQDADLVADRYMAADAEEARSRILAGQEPDRDAEAAGDLASAVRRLGR